jgi:hypothetical protein
MIYYLLMQQAVSVVLHLLLLRVLDFIGQHAMVRLLKKAICVRLLEPQYKIMFEITTHEIVLYPLIRQS